MSNRRFEHQAKGHDFVVESASGRGFVRDSLTVAPLGDGPQASDGSRRRSMHPVFLHPAKGNQPERKVSKEGDEVEP